MARRARIRRSFRGLGRVDEMLDSVVTSARRKGARLPFAANTAYVNTIPPEAQPRASRRPQARTADPPLRALERRGDRGARPTRNPPSSAAISRASSRRRRSTTPASCISGTPPTTTTAAISIYFQGHSSPGIYARAFLEGRLSEEQLLNFRQEVGGKGLSSYPHPWLMPDFWQFPTVSMGLGPLMAIYQARFLRYLHGRGLADTAAAQGLGVLRRRRNGRAGIARRDLARRTREARQPDLRHQLQPAAARRAGARQRQDRPGARGRLPRRRLERHQVPLGLQLGRAARQGHDRQAAAADGGMRRRRVPGLQVEGRRLHPQELLRPLSRDRGDGRGLDRRRRSGR